MRICSLLPSATETLFALGLGDSVVGVTHECDFPPEAARKPALLRPRVDPQEPPAAVDRRVSELARRGESLYAIDADLLCSISPDLIVTQDLCHVCAASPGDLQAALRRLPKRTRVLSLSPRSLREVWDDIRRVGEATGRKREAQALALTLEQRVATIENRVRNAAPHPRVLCLEWLDPLYVGGHWIPEMVAKAGGEDVLGRAGQPSRRVSTDEIAAADPQVIVILPCGYDLDRTVREFAEAQIAVAWSALPALRAGRVFAVDANGYFSRPGPRLAEGVSILAHIFHPGLLPPEPGSRFHQVLAGRRA
ncbi:MAG TPA: cobalamin-binding protein [Candidatus Cybelea sp.]|nr:cobalamin-binding protein [Candidatus Cybelea sp.]